MRIEITKSSYFPHIMTGISFSFDSLSLINPLFRFRIASIKALGMLVVSESHVAVDFSVTQSLTSVESKGHSREELVKPVCYDLAIT